MLSLQQKACPAAEIISQQIQYQKLLQLNTLALEQRIKTELELNPILEEVPEEELEMMEKELDSDREQDEDSDNKEEESSTDDEFEIEDFMMILKPIATISTAAPMMKCCVRLRPPVLP